MALLVAAAGAGMLAAGMVVAGAAPAAAQPTVLYAAATTVGSGDCADAADACTLSTALAGVPAGGVIQLVTPGSTARYVGNWSVSTPGTSASAPVTIESAPELSDQAVLDGDGPNAPSGEACSTASCSGPVLTVPGGAYVSLSGITVTDGQNAGTNGDGAGGLNNAGAVTITGCTFTGNAAYGDGGAIDNGDGSNGAPGTGSVTVTGSTFTGNTANDGGAIDNGDNHGGGSVTVTGSTFSSNTANWGGAIDSGDNHGGGSVTVTGSTFSSNTARGDGGAIDSGDSGGGGSVTVTGATFTGNTADLYGGALDSGDNGGGGSVTVTGSAFTANTADDGGAIDNGFGDGGPVMVTVTGSTFSGNTADAGGFFPQGDGGAIDSGDDGGRGSVAVTASTFSGNTADRDGGAIDSGDNGSGNLGAGGGGSVTVTASTLSGNTANSDGGAIDNGDNGGNGGGLGGGGGGSVTVTASTLSGNTANGDGGTIDNGDNGSGGLGGGSVRVAGDVFDGSCAQVGGSWSDSGYNAGSDSSCSGWATGDVTAGSSSALDLGSLASNGGPTQTIAPQTGSPVIGIIPDPATVTVGGSQVVLCPALDQRGYASAGGTACDAGAVQTSGIPPALTVKDSATPGSFNTAGQVISYSYRVSNTGAGTLSGVTVTDPAVPDVSCPAASLAPGTSETCSGSYTVTSADLAGGAITDTATVAGVTTNGLPVDSSPATLTVPEGWPPAVSGTYRPPVGSAEGYYLSVTGHTWQLLVTHPSTNKVSFAGQVSVPAGTLGHLTLISPHPGHQASITGSAVTFTLPDSGRVTGLSFTTSTKVTSITFTLSIGGQPATATQIYLGSSPTQAGSPSPLTYTR